MAEFIVVVGLAVVFALIVGVVVLRALTVIQQMAERESVDRAGLLRDVDQSHVQAFTNAMTAIETVQSRVAAENMAMFNKTMDMVHGPAQLNDPNTTYAVDDPSLDARPAWLPNDDGDDIGQMVDPTDDDGWLALGGDVGHDDTNGRAVSIRPGETLVPGQ